MASPLVFIGAPCERHIPYFAMPVPRSREKYSQRLDIETDLLGFVGRPCAAWIKARAERDRIELIKTRNYVPPQTAFYATWLVFGDDVDVYGCHLGVRNRNGPAGMSCETVQGWCTALWGRGP